jgi:hypothetical protein
MIGGTKREKDDDPLPQSCRTPDRRGIPEDLDARIAIAENRSNIEDRARLLGDFWIRPGQCSPCDDDTGGTEDAGNDKSDAPTQQRSDPAEGERQRRADSEGTRIPRRNARPYCPLDTMRKRLQAPASAIPATARNPSVGRRLSHSATPKHDSAQSILDAR